MSLDRFVELYLSYRNDFLTIEAFAAYYNLSHETATKIIDCGRTISELEE